MPSAVIAQFDNPKKMGIKVLSKIFPLIQWGRNYSTEFAVYDFIAGITVALTVLPQSLAYAALAGLEPQVNITPKC